MREEMPSGAGGRSSPGVRIENVAALIDFKLNEFVRLRWPWPPGYGVPAATYAIVPVTTYDEFNAEEKKVLEKIDALEKALYPPAPPDNDQPISPPVYDPTKEAVTDAFEAARRAIHKAQDALAKLDHERALEALKTAKRELKKKDVKGAAVAHGLQSSLSSIVEELGAMISYLEGILKD